MKEQIITYLLKKLEKTPGIEIQILLNLTAEAFQVPARNVMFLPHEEALAAYADFTKHCMNAGTYDPERIFQLSRRFAVRLRAASGLRETEDLRKLLKLLYRNIGIEISGDIPEEIIFRSCRFSRVYDPKQCEAMSAIDSGIISGLFGCGPVRFTHRLTEGCAYCRACAEGDHL